MKGFAENWKDLPDYILGITKEIWEERGIDTLNHYYTKDIPMRFPEGISIGNKNTINGIFKRGACAKMEKGYHLEKHTLPKNKFNTLILDLFIPIYCSNFMAVASCNILQRTSKKGKS